jgi:outer membrane receptor protein involved in Fe transport
MINFKLWRRVVVVLVLLFPSLALSQNATLTGKVVDSGTGEALIGANVLLAGTTIGTTTNLDGIYTLRDLKPGSYDMQVSYVSYTRKLIRDIRLESGKATTINVDLQSEAFEMEEVVVEAAAVRNTEAALLALQRRAAGVSDAISEEQIKRSPDSDAGDAIKRVTGVSVVGGKYTYVRGLGERYSNTQLNDVTIPSPEPEKKVVPFDLFPANMIQNLITAKTFTPDQPGNFSGGLVKINTREFPPVFTMSAGVSTGFNTLNASAAIPTYTGGGMDFLGIDDGTRRLPSAVPSTPPMNRPTYQESSELLGLFSNQWTPVTRSAMPNLGLNFSVGDQFQAGDLPIGYLASVSYSSDMSYRERHERYPTQEIDAATGRVLLKDDYTVQQGSYSVLWGALLNLSTRLSQTDKISIKSMYNRSTDDETRIINGFSAQGSSSGYYRATRMQFVARSIFSSVLSGEHQLKGLLDSRLEWRASFSTADRDEPDNRETVYARELNSGRYFLPNNFGSGNGRFYSDLHDRSFNGGFDWVVPVDGMGQNSRLKVGAFAENRSRDFAARRFLFSDVKAGSQYLTPEELFTPENVAAGNINFLDATAGNDTYSAEEATLAGYAMIDFAVTQRLRLITGLRYELTGTTVNSFDPFGARMTDAMQAKLDDANVLPSVNLVYSLSSTMNLRAAYSHTIARPEFRELAPFRFDDYRTSTFGNAALKQTDIINYDLRWEWYPNPGEIIAVSAFYKVFDDPIERVLYPSSNNNIIVPINANDAESIGMEFEIRKNLGFASSVLDNFNLGMNFTVMQSSIFFREDEQFAVRAIPGLESLPAAGFANSQRPLEGMSPYVINLSLGYHAATGTNLMLFYNVLGKRIREIGISGYDDTYEMPRNQVDVTIAQKVMETLSVKLSMRNLLDEDYIFRMGELETTRYKVGRSFSLGLSYSI